MRAVTMVSIEDARAAVKAGSATALAERQYGLIAEQDGAAGRAGGIGINSFLALSRERALRQAERVDAMAWRGGRMRVRWRGCRWG